MFSDDDSMPHLEGRTKGHTKDTWKTTESMFTENKTTGLSHTSRPHDYRSSSGETFTRGSISESTNPAGTINSFQSKKNTQQTH